MKNRLFTLTLLASLTLSTTAFGACNTPDDPEIPDGSSASGADMLKAKKAVEGFVAAAEEYMSCGVASAQVDRMSNHMQKVVEKFNVELRAYKAKG